MCANRISTRELSWAERSEAPPREARLFFRAKRGPPPPKAEAGPSEARRYPTEAADEVRGDQVRSEEAATESNTDRINILRRQESVLSTYGISLILEISTYDWA